MKPEIKQAIELILKAREAKMRLLLNGKVEPASVDSVVKITKDMTWAVMNAADIDEVGFLGALGETADLLLAINDAMMLGYTLRTMMGQEGSMPPNGSSSPGSSCPN